METSPFKVFVSYSRVDAAFADEIEAGLEYDGGFVVLLDRHDIHEGEDWKHRLGALIAQADTVVFVLSPASVVSPICRWEVEQAQALSKRIVPIQAEPLGDLEAPPALAALNYVRFDGGRSFMAGLTGLRRALETDIAWLREHTRLLTRAQEWQAAGRADNRLLSGSDIASAKAWLEHSPTEGLQPTDLHRDFIQASDRAEALRLSAERERARALEQAVFRTRTALAVAVLFAVVAGGAAWYADAQRRRSEEATELARTESQRADAFVNLVSQDPAGRRAMEKTCLEAIEVTTTLATTQDDRAWQQAVDRFWELYYAPMYIVELHQRKRERDAGRTDGSAIERSMVEFGTALNAFGRDLSPDTLCNGATKVWEGCTSYLRLPAPRPHCAVRQRIESTLPKQ